MFAVKDKNGFYRYGNRTVEIGFIWALDCWQIMMTEQGQSPDYRQFNTYGAAMEYANKWLRQAN